MIFTFQNTGEEQGRLLIFMLDISDFQDSLTVNTTWAKPTAKISRVRDCASIW